MLRIALVILVSLGLAAASLAGFASSSDAAEAAAADDAFAPFLAELRAAVAKQQKAKVAAMCEFPMRSYEFAGAIAKATQKKLAPGQERPPLDPAIEEAAFLRHYALLLDATAKRNLLTRKPLRHEGEEPGQHWYSVGMKAGKTWSAWFVFARTDAGAWKLRGTDNVSQ